MISSIERLNGKTPWKQTNGSYYGTCSDKTVEEKDKRHKHFKGEQTGNDFYLYVPQKWKFTHLRCD